MLPRTHDDPHMPEHCRQSGDLPLAGSGNNRSADTGRIARDFTSKRAQHLTLIAIL
jgi:hypothetical protein